MTSTETSDQSSHDEKSALRREILAARAELSHADIDSVGRAISDVILQQPEIASARVVASYLSFGTEPKTTDVLDHLFGQGVRVLLPVLRTDDDLEWADYEGPGTLAHGRHGVIQPTGETLGTDAIAAADVVLCPGLAVDLEGIRLGRGGGSYDRTLPRAQPHAWICVLVYDGEVRDYVPRSPHDHPVNAAATPTTVLRFT